MATDSGFRFAHHIPVLRSMAPHNDGSIAFGKDLNLSIKESPNPGCTAFGANLQIMFP